MESINNSENEIIQVIKDGVDDLSTEQLIALGARCIAEIDGMFFLLVEISVGQTRTVIIFRITAAQAAALLRAGIPRCQIVTTIPVSMPGRQVTLICAFVVGANVFLVFLVENMAERLVLVRVPLCPIVGGIDS